MLDFYTSTFPKARKEHVCDLCGGIIGKGEVYHRYSGKYDGEMFDDKYHLVCQNIISAYCEKTGDNEYDNDYICDWLRDEHCLECSKYNNDECDSLLLSCPIIREHYQKKEEE